MSQFTLEVRSFEPPSVPEQPADATAKDVFSPLLVSKLSPTDPLRITVSLPSARPKNVLWPATHIQMSIHWPRTGDSFIPEELTTKDFEPVENGDEEHLYRIEIPPKFLGRGKVNEGASPDAQIWFHAWKGEKLLDKFNMGTIEKLGLVGMKPHRPARDS